MDTTKVPVGKSLGPRASFCDPGEIAAFARAINDDNPMYQDGRAVPPTYAVVPIFDTFLSLGQPGEDATAGGRGAGHGEHELFIHRPIRPGETLHTTAEMGPVVTSKAGMNVFVKLTSLDDDGQPVIEQYWSSMYVGPVSGGDQGGEMPDHLFPEEARSRKVGTMVLGTTLDQTFRYAGASGDRAIIHVNDQVADYVSGGRGKFLQGMCSLGVVSRALVALAGGGDPRRIRRIAVRFQRYVFPGQDIEVSVYDVGPGPGGRHVYAFEAASGGETALRHGLVEVDPVE
jgi:acyl dehydratase